MLGPGQGFVEHPVMPFQRGGGVDVDRRADRGGDVGHRHVLGMKGAVAVKEMVHEEPPGVMRRPRD